jgi:hypothetical protein
MGVNSTLVAGVGVAVCIRAISPCSVSGVGLVSPNDVAVKVAIAVAVADDAGVVLPLLISAVAETVAPISTCVAGLMINSGVANGEEIAAMTVGDGATSDVLLVQNVLVMPNHPAMSIRVSPAPSTKALPLVEESESRLLAGPSLH